LERTSESSEEDEEKLKVCDKKENLKEDEENLI
jgi:hypothetical protein